MRLATAVFRRRGVGPTRLGLTRPAWVALSAAIAIATACKKDPPEADERLAVSMGAAIDSAFARNKRAGALPARDSLGELGLLMSARLSPDGRWLVAFDDVAPHFKIFNDSGVAVANIRLSNDEFPGIQPEPAYAVSNDEVMLLRSEGRVAEFYDLTGKFLERVSGFGFEPLSATSVGNGVWLAYGPSDSEVAGQATWVHCLYRRPGRPPRWESGFRDSVLTVSQWAINRMAPYVERTSDVLVDHVQSTAAVLTVRCGPDNEAPTVRVQARATDDYLGMTPDQYLLDDDGFASGFTRVGNAVWRITVGADRVLTLRSIGSSLGLHPLGGGPASRRFLDSREGVGVLLSDERAMPLLFVLSDSVLATTLKLKP